MRCILRPSVVVGVRVPVDRTNITAILLLFLLGRFYFFVFRFHFDYYGVCRETVKANIFSFLFIFFSLFIIMEIRTHLCGTGRTVLIDSAITHPILPAPATHRFLFAIYSPRVILFFFRRRRRRCFSISILPFNVVSTVIVVPYSDRFLPPIIH